MGSVGAIKTGGSRVERNTQPSAFDFEGLTQAEQLKKIQELQNAMGQTGLEAGDPNADPYSKLYANTGKAFNVNMYLMSDGKKITSTNSQWNWWANKSDIEKIIKQMDAGMKPLSEAVKTNRYIDAGGLARMTGLNVNSKNFDQFLNNLQNGQGNTFSAMMQNINYTHKAYTSTTYDTKHGSFDSRDIKLEMTLNKGTPAIVTSNHKEHEIIAGRSAKYKFTGNWRIDITPKGKRQLVLEVSV